MSEIRLSKLMSQRGICSRREADEYIKRGWVLVDGEVVDTLGQKVLESQHVTLAKPAQRQQSNRVTVLINKPMDYVSGTPEPGYHSAMLLLENSNRQFANEKAPARQGLAPAGRLDIDSMGLLVYTQDGVVAKQLIGADSDVEKEYLVWVEGSINEAKLAMLRHGIKLDDKPLRPAKVDLLPGPKLRIVLKEGRKRQIRRMAEAVDLQVTRLMRVRIGNVRLGKLEEGKWRYLRADESF